MCLKTLGSWRLILSFNKEPAWHISSKHVKKDAAHSQSQNQFFVTQCWFSENLKNIYVSILYIYIHKKIAFGLEVVLRLEFLGPTQNTKISEKTCQSTVVINFLVRKLSFILPALGWNHFDESFPQISSSDHPICWATGSSGVAAFSIEKFSVDSVFCAEKVKNNNT